MNQSASLAPVFPTLPAQKQELLLQAADRFRAWRADNDLGAESETREAYAELLARIDANSGRTIDWNRFVTSPEAAFLNDFSGFIRHANPDGTLRRNYYPSCAS